MTIAISTNNQIPYYQIDAESLNENYLKTPSVLSKILNSVSNIGNFIKNNSKKLFFISSALSLASFYYFYYIQFLINSSLNDINSQIPLNLTLEEKINKLNEMLLSPVSKILNNCHQLSAEELKLPFNLTQCDPSLLNDNWVFTLNVDMLNNINITFSQAMEFLSNNYFQAEEIINGVKKELYERFKHDLSESLFSNRPVEVLCKIIRDCFPLTMPPLHKVCNLRLSM